jgi:hypothetical protein
MFGGPADFLDLSWVNKDMSRGLRRRILHTDYSSLVVAL